MARRLLGLFGWMHQNKGNHVGKEAQSYLTAKNTEITKESHIRQQR
ncbi:MAG: hypothetical protein ACXWKH_11990 [Limisphaerales bacterium]